MTPTPDRSSAPSALRRVAVLTALAFGCATVRAPTSTISGPVPVRDGVAEPQLELWLESGRQISPAESAQATAQAKAALESALAHVAVPQGDTLLVVRAQGVARTSSRRTDQRAAVAGLVVGAVVVVAAVVVLVVSGKGGSGGGRSLPKGARAAPAPRPVPPRGGAPVPVFVARPVHRGPSVNVGVIVAADGGPAPASDLPGHYVVEPPHPWAAPADGAGPAALVSVPLPPPRPLDVEERGFFAGDMLRLELVVVDRGDGAPLWTKEVEGEVDPRDAGGVERLLGAALADANGWTPGAAFAAPRRAAASGTAERRPDDR